MRPLHRETRLPALCRAFYGKMAALLDYHGCDGEMTPRPSVVMLRAAERSVGPGTAPCGYFWLFVVRLPLICP